MSYIALTTEEIGLAKAGKTPEAVRSVHGRTHCGVTVAKALVDAATNHVQGAEETAEGNPGLAAMPDKHDRVAEEIFKVVTGGGMMCLERIAAILRREYGEEEG